MRLLVTSTLLSAILFNTVFTIELIDTSAGCRCFLLSGIERMAFGADLHVDIWFGRTCYESVSAVAGYSCLIVFGMDSFSHCFSPLLIIRELPAVADFRPMPLRYFHGKISRTIPASPYRYLHDLYDCNTTYIIMQDFFRKNL